MASSITETHLTQSEPHPGAPSANPTVLVILFAISFSHLLNDTIQSLIPAIYPLLKASFQLSFVQVGFITLAFQMTASILQPFVGWYTDRRPKPYSLACGMGLTLGGLVLLSTPLTTPWWSGRPRSSAWARRFSTRNRLASPISLLAGGTVSRNRFFKSGEMPAVR